MSLITVAEATEAKKRASLARQATRPPEVQIREHYQSLGIPLAHKNPWEGLWKSLSQYGVVLKGDFRTQEEAEAYTLGFYSEGIYLIRQYHVTIDINRILK